MGDDAEVQIILRWKEANAAAHAEVMRKLTEITAAQTAANAAVAASATPIRMSAAAWGGFAAAALIALPAVTNLVPLIVSSTVALVSFAVAGAGTLALMGGIAAGFAAIGAGVLFLGGGGGIGAAAALTTATDKLTTVKDAWAEQAAPMAATITQWAAGAIPTIQAFGSAVMTWFGDRLPAVLSATGVVFRNLTPDFQAFYQFLGGVADKVGPQMAGVFQGAVHSVLIPAATGLITNLVRLSDWFQKELPTLGPVVQQVLGGMGSIIQGVATAWAKWNDWIVANWKPTIDQAKKDWDNIANGWKGVDFSGLTNGLIGIGQAIKGVGDAFAIAFGAAGLFIKSLQDWANNNAFWAGLQGHLIDIGRSIGGVLDGMTALGIDQPPGYKPPSAPLVGGSNSNQSGGVRTASASGGGGATTTTTNNTVIVHGVDTNNADLVSRTIARNLRKLGMT